LQRLRRGRFQRRGSGPALDLAGDLARRADPLARALHAHLLTRELDEVAAAQQLDGAADERRRQPAGEKATVDLARRALGGGEVERAPEIAAERQRRGGRGEQRRRGGLRRPPRSPPQKEPGGRTAGGEGRRRPPEA